MYSPEGLLTVVQPAHTITPFIKWAVEERMRFIPLLSGQTGHGLFFRRTGGVDFGWDKSSRIDTSAPSHWFAHTPANSSHPEVLPSRWPLSVTCGRRSIIYQHTAAIHFTRWRKWHWAEGASLSSSQHVKFYKRGRVRYATREVCPSTGFFPACWDI